MKRLKYLTEINPSLPRNRVPQSDDIVSFIPMERIGEDGSLDLSEVRPARDICQGYTAMLDGDLVIAKITPCFENGKGALCQGLHGGIGFGTTELMVLRAKNQSDSRYLYWLTRGYHFRNWGEAEMRGSAGQKRVTEEFVSNYLSAELTPAEQRRIADYLDAATSKIDRLVALRRRQMELLKEQRAALIQQAVTRGLDPASPLKDSGIPWLGQIPKHWTLKRLKHLSPRQSVGLVINPSTHVVDEGIPFLFGSDISESSICIEKVRRISPESNATLKASRLNAGDLVSVRVGYPGITAVIPPELDQCNCASLLIIRQSTSFHSQWLCHAMNSPVGRFQVSLVQYGAAQEQFNVGHAVDFVFPTPPLAEQREIVDFIDTKCARFDHLYAAYARQIEMLGEYRAALIHEAVTGQKAV